eukprot:TRINITY_DN29946_c0_g2_i2.p1 TRINITY_DN29946_c0_g2~~TRINITY_DN29946_c0_g2_i2.p1  ORF type:complete len:360 (+),score=167.35 TRINITY_DN29946_c0_g2_i2:47-1081(+)
MSKRTALAFDEAQADGDAEKYEALNQMADDDEDIDLDDDDDAQPGAGVHTGDEMQQIDFDVDMMQECDVDPAFHLLQRWCPVRWEYNVDEVISPLCASPITSVVKIPDDYNTDDLKMLNDEGMQIFGIVGLINMHAMRQSAANRTLFDNLSLPSTTEDMGRADIGTILTEESLRQKPVALIMNERLTNLPPELGAQLHVNLFEELAEKQVPGVDPKEAHPQYEYFLILSKVRLNADKELEELEEEKRALLAAAKGKPARPTQKKRAPAPTDSAEPAISETKALFSRSEEMYYFRHRDTSFATKRYILDEELSREVVIAPIVVHRSKMPAVIKDIKSMDDYFDEQ